MATFRADLHVHTLLSPCADIEMIPPLIVQTAVEKNISLIAITDHNSTANVEAVRKAARSTDLHVLPGVELQTSEEVHVLSIFDSLDQVREFQRIIDDALPPAENNIEFFGEQFVVDETGEFIRREERLLLTSTELTLSNAFNHTSRLGGLFIPAHVNRKAFGLLQVLGFVPIDIPLEILEISSHLVPEQARITFPALSGYALVQNGDAHFLDDIKGANLLTLETPTVAEIRLAILHREGRHHEFLPV